MAVKICAILMPSKVVMLFDFKKDLTKTANWRSQIHSQIVYYNKFTKYVENISVFQLA